MTGITTPICGPICGPVVGAITGSRVVTSGTIEHIVVHGQSNGAGLGGVPPIDVTSGLSDKAAMFALGTNTWLGTDNPSTPTARTRDFTVSKLNPATSGYENTLIQLTNQRALQIGSVTRKVVATYAAEGSKRLAELSSLDLGTAPDKGFWPTLLDDMDRVKAYATSHGLQYRMHSFGIISCEKDCDFIINPGEAASSPLLARDTASSRLRMMFREASAKAVSLNSSAPQCWAVQPATEASTFSFTIAQAVLNAVDPAWTDPVSGEACFPNSLCIGPSYAYDSAINSYPGATRNPDDFTGYAGRNAANAIHYTPQGHRLMGAKAKQALAVKASGSEVALRAYQVTQDTDFPADRTRFVVWIKIYAAPLVFDTSYLPQIFSYGMAAYPNSAYGTDTGRQTIFSASIYDDGQGSAINGLSGAVAGIARLKIKVYGTALPANSRLAIGRQPYFGTTVTLTNFTFNSQASVSTRRGQATYDYTFADASGELTSTAAAALKRGAFRLAKSGGTGPTVLWIDEVISAGAGVIVLRGEQALGGSVTAGATYCICVPGAATNFRDSDSTEMGVSYADTFYGDQSLIGTPMPAYNWLCLGELDIP